MFSQCLIPGLHISGFFLRQSISFTILIQPHKCVTMIEHIKPSSKQKIYSIVLYCIVSIILTWLFITKYSVVKSIFLVTQTLGTYQSV